MSLLVAWVVAVCQVNRILSVAPVLGSSWLNAGLWVDPSGTPYLATMSEGGTSVWSLVPPSSQPIALLGSWRPLFFTQPAPHPSGFLFLLDAPRFDRLHLARWDLAHRRFSSLGVYDLGEPSLPVAASLPPCQNRIGLMVESPTARKLITIRLVPPFTGTLIPGDVVWVGECDVTHGVWKVIAYNPANLLAIHQGQFDFWVRVATLSPLTGRILDAFQMARPPFTGISLHCFGGTSPCWTVLQSSPYSGPVRPELFRFRIQNGGRLQVEPVWRGETCGLVIPLSDKEWVVWDHQGNWVLHPSRRPLSSTLPEMPEWCRSLYPSNVQVFANASGDRAVVAFAPTVFTESPRALPAHPRWMLLHVSRTSVRVIHAWPAGWFLRNKPWGTYEQGWWVFQNREGNRVEVWQHICN